MKQLVCEMCGSTDLIKQDGVFVCQSCGTKYSVEEAKKMMIEGPVEVHGTVKVDDTEKIKNFFKMASSAYDADNKQEAENYCNKIIEIDPENADAWLLKGFSAAWQSTLNKLRMDEFLSCVSNAFQYAKSIDDLKKLGQSAYQEWYKLSLAINAIKLNHVVSFPNTWNEYIHFPTEALKQGILIQAHYAIAFKSLNNLLSESQKAELDSLSTTLGLDNTLNAKMKSEVVNSGIQLWNDSLSKYNSSNDGYPTDYMFESMVQNGLVAMLMLGYAIPKDTSEIDEDLKPVVIKACKNLITMKEVWIGLKSYKINFSGGYKSYSISKEFNYSYKQEAINDIKQCHNIIKFCDPTYIVPSNTIPTVNEPKKSTGGCYVATAVYGSYDCPQVWTLRRYRDYTLAETWYGRAFIHFYYAISPTLVKWFGHTEWFKNMWKEKLDRMVANLNADGVEDTPYNDRSW